MAVIDYLVADYELDEASGDALDSKNGYTATETSGTIGSAGGPGGSNAREFVIADTEWFSKSDNADLSMGDFDFSVEAWIYLADVSVFAQGILAKHDASGAGNMEFDLLYDGNGAQIKFRASSGSGYANVTTCAANWSPSVNTWYQIIGRHDATGNTLEVIVNNFAVSASTGYSAGSYDSGAPLIIGADDHAGGYPLGGRMARARIWKRKLSDADISWLFNSNSSRSFADLVAEAGGGSFPVGGGIV